MADFYEMSLENGQEYIVDRYKKIQKYPLGMWIIEFVDVDWHAMTLQCHEILKDASNTSPMSERFAVYYRGLYQTLAHRHPLFRDLFVEELEWQVRSVFGMEEPISKEEALWREELLMESKLPMIRDYFPETLLRKCMEVFESLNKMKQDVLRILEEVMKPEDPERNVVRAYYEFNRSDWAHMIAVHENYSELHPRFHFSFGNRIYDYRENRNNKQDKVKDEQLLEAGRTYMVTDSLPALTLWELDTICARNLSLRRCKNCGKWFIPTSITNCYCDRPLQDNPEKTCKDIGAASQYQKNVNKDAAEKLFKKVRNRVQMYKTRNEEEFPEFARYYNIWQLQAKDLKIKVDEGTMSYEEFERIIDRPSDVIFGMKGQLPESHK